MTGVQGLSEPFRVIPSEAAGFAFHDVPLVVWADRPFEFTLRAVDVYGNQVPECNPVVALDDWTGTLSASDSAIQGQTVVALENGEFSGTFVVATTATSDALAAHILEASDGCSDADFQSTSATFPVYDLDCEDPPVTTLSTGGRDNIAVACEGDPVTFSASAQSDYGTMDVVWTFDDGNMAHGPYAWDVQHAYQWAGYYRPAVSAVDRRLCASWVEAQVYVGVHDGSPTGPMAMKVVQGDLPLIAGADDGSQVATVEVQATDCREDAALYPKSWDGDGYLITVLPSMGDVESGDVSDRPGIQYLLGPHTGTVQFDFSVGNIARGGIARVAAVYEGVGADGQPTVFARGSVDIEVENDHVPPYVVSYAPAGSFYIDTDVVTVLFNEPVRPDNLTTPEALDQVNHADDPVVEVQVASQDTMGTFVRWPISAIALDPTGRWLSVYLGQPVALEHAWYQVQVRLASAEGAPSITDIDGNPLDGDWDGVHLVDPDTGTWVDDFVWRFGRFDDVSPVLSEADCSVSQPVFSPDGQDGEGEEADSTVITGEVELDTGIKAINLIVLSPYDGSVAASLWSTGSGGDSRISFSIPWDGTGMDGQRLPNGLYTFQVNAADSNDNWVYRVCEGQVEIRNPVDLGDFL